MFAPTAFMTEGEYYPFGANTYPVAPTVVNTVVTPPPVVNEYVHNMVPFPVAVPVPPPPPRVSIIARSRDPRAQAVANELLNRYRGVEVTHPSDVQRLLDSSARTLSYAMPNPVVA